MFICLFVDLLICFVVTKIGFFLLPNDRAAIVFSRRPDRGTSPRRGSGPGTRPSASAHRGRLRNRKCSPPMSVRNEEWGVGNEEWGVRNEE